jgi:peptidyl-prolyl cis-trans isomerase A (cyclophilin A)
VSHHRFDNGVFHRTVTLGNQPDNKVKIEVIQGGPNSEMLKKDFAPIQIETTNVTGIKHLNGTVSMARNEPNTATSNFFICINDQPELDFGGKRNPDGQGFAAFGKVTKGMDIVKAIQLSPAKGQSLTPPIKILRASINK